eukprot:TRINITY_DN5761_c0_g2_i3.p1 TRINITY_DN5761_c0_g2~~TRINITY_DN5761_c0_g2_i3.p1  ORF type:complete len:647 (-),score=111.63 TRINITY_DN5761_c0_g2_i3:216-2156(-)
MRLNVKVREKSLPINVGMGGQLVRWLAFTAAQRYCSMSGYPVQQLPPLYVLEEVPPRSMRGSMAPPPDNQTQKHAENLRRNAMDSANSDLRKNSLTVSIVDPRSNSVLEKEGLRSSGGGDLKTSGGNSANTVRLRLLDPFTMINAHLKDGQTVRVYLQGDVTPTVGVLPPVAGVKYSVLASYDWYDSSTFSETFFALLHHSNIEEFAEWTPGGNSLVIKDKNLFSHVLMPKYFPHHNMDIFITNLKSMGFIPVGVEDGLRLEYLHPFGRDVQKMANLRKKIVQTVNHAAVAFKNLAVKKKLLAPSLSDTLLQGENTDLPLQHFKRKLKNLALFKDFLLTDAGLDIEKVVTGDDPKDEVLSLQSIVLDSLGLLRSFFRYFCLTVGDTHAMTSQTWRRMCQLCYISDVTFALKDVDIIFIQVNHPTATPSSSVHKGGSTFDMHRDSPRTKKDTIHLLIFTEFVGAMIRVALKKYHTKSTKPSKKLSLLIENNVAPFATQAHKEDYTLLFQLSKDYEDAGLLETLQNNARTMELTFQKLSAGIGMNYEKFKTFLTLTKVIESESQYMMAKQSFILSSVLLGAHDIVNEMNKDHFIKALVTLSKLKHRQESISLPFPSYVAQFLSDIFQNYQRAGFKRNPSDVHTAGKQK